jgi:hypothetical protein
MIHELHAQPLDITLFIFDTPDFGHLQASKIHAKMVLSALNADMRFISLAWSQLAAMHGSHEIGSTAQDPPAVAVLHLSDAIACNGLHIEILPSTGSRLMTTEDVEFVARWEPLGRAGFDAADPQPIQTAMFPHQRGGNAASGSASRYQICEPHHGLVAEDSFAYECVSGACNRSMLLQSAHDDVCLRASTVACSNAIHLLKFDSLRLEDALPGHPPSSVPGQDEASRSTVTFKVQPCRLACSSVQHKTFNWCCCDVSPVSAPVRPVSFGQLCRASKSQHMPILYCCTVLHSVMLRA